MRPATRSVSLMFRTVQKLSRYAMELHFFSLVDVFIVRRLVSRSMTRLPSLFSQNLSPPARGCSRGMCSWRLIRRFSQEASKIMSGKSSLHGLGLIRMFAERLRHLERACLRIAQRRTIQRNVCDIVLNLHYIQ